MNLEEALKIFDITDLSNTNLDEVKRIYRRLCFLYHPDAHQNEDTKKYNEMMAKVNSAYEILKYQCIYAQNNKTFTSQEEQSIKKQTAKEKILMDIIVKSYYASKSEIDKINSDFLDLFLSIPQKVGHMSNGLSRPVSGYRHIDEVFEQKSLQESTIMKEYIKKFALEFVTKYGIEINFVEVSTGDYINFLNNTNWYEKYINYKEPEEQKYLK